MSNVFTALDWRVTLGLGMLVVLAGLFVLAPPRRHALRYALAICAIELGTLTSIRGVVAANPAFWWQFAVAYALVLVPGLFAASVLTRLRWWGAAGFVAPLDRRGLPVAGLLALCLVLPLVGLSAVGVRHMTAGLLGFQVAFLLLDIFMEEATYRGIILESLRPQGALFACLFSGFLFGLSHLDNLFLAGRPLAIGYQVFEASLLGIVFAVARLRMNSIWPVMSAHAAYDFMLVLAYGHALPVVPSLLGFVLDTTVNGVLAGVALILVRRSRVRQREPQAGGLAA